MDPRSSPKRSRATSSTTISSARLGSGSRPSTTTPGHDPPTAGGGGQQSRTGVAEPFGSRTPSAKETTKGYVVSTSGRAAIWARTSASNAGSLGRIAASRRPPLAARYRGSARSSAGRPPRPAAASPNVTPARRPSTTHERQRARRSARAHIQAAVTAQPTSGTWAAARGQAPGTGGAGLPPVGRAARPLDALAAVGRTESAARTGEAVQVDRVATQDPLLVGRRQARDVVTQLLHHARERAVGVGVVGAPHDPVGAHHRREHGQRVLVDLEADPALPGEVLAREVLHLRACTRRSATPGGRAARPRTAPTRRRPRGTRTAGPGWRSITPRAISCAHAIMCSNGVRRGVEHERVVRRAVDARASGSRAASPRGSRW